MKDRVTQLISELRPELVDLREPQWGVANVMKTFGEIHFSTFWQYNQISILRGVRGAQNFLAKNFLCGVHQGHSALRGRLNCARDTTAWFFQWFFAAL